jgi:hypothetical protein
LPDLLNKRIRPGLGARYLYRRREMLKKAMYAALLVGISYGCLPNCCDLKLPNLGKCFKAQPCEILFALLGGISL